MSEYLMKILFLTFLVFGSIKDGDAVSLSKVSDPDGSIQQEQESKSFSLEQAIKEFMSTGFSKSDSELSPEVSERTFSILFPLISKIGNIVDKVSAAASDVVIHVSKALLNSILPFFKEKKKAPHGAQVIIVD